MLSVTLKLFLTDVNEAITLDPNSNQLNYCTSAEAANAEELLMNYLNEYYAISLNDEPPIKLIIDRKHLDGQGENTALWLYFSMALDTSVEKLTLRNAVFTDLFFDQSNLVYVHNDGKSKSFMLNKKKPEHSLKF